MTVSHGQGWTPLMYAAAVGDLAAVKVLLGHEVHVNARDPQTGRTALMLAASGGHAEIVTMLLDHGGELEAVDLAKRSARSHAELGGHHSLALDLDIRDYSPALKRDLQPLRGLVVKRVESPPAQSAAEGKDQ